MKNKFKLLISNISGISKDTSTLMLGTLIANSIPIFLQFYLKRVFTPTDFGTYDVYLKIFAILVALSSLKYESAILLAKKESDAKHVMYLGVILSAIISLICLLVISIFRGSIIYQFPNLNEISLFLLPFSVLFFSIFNNTNLFLIRKGKFQLSSTSKILRRFLEGISQSISGSYKVSTGLVFGDIVGNFGQAVYSIWKVRRTTSIRLIDFNKLKKVAKEFVDLPKFTLVPNILNTFVLGSLTFLILDKFSIDEVGYLEFTQRILAIPSVFISTAISQVVFQRVSKMVNKNQKILPFIFSMIAFLACCALLLVLVVQLFADYAFVLIGGEDWIKSGEYARILVYGTCVMFIFSPLGRVLIALKRYRLNSVWELGKFLIILSFFFLDTDHIQNFLISYTIAICFFYIVYGFLIIYSATNYQKQLS